MANENVIRDKLAKSLTILEPGLALIETNHPLPNKAGAKGFIDILARDRLGNFAVIELKRSDQASRQALFEILKYMALFMEKHGVGPHQIRCFIVSTSWRELLVPYSEFRRRCESQTEGFEITVDGKGRVLTARKVEDQSLDHASLFYHHSIILFKSASERAKSMKPIKEALVEKGAIGYMLFRLDHKGTNPNVIYPFATYVVPTKVDDKVQKRLAKIAEKDLGEDADDFLTKQGYCEELLLADVVITARRRLTNLDTDVEIGFPEKFTGLVEHEWAMVGIERKGPFASKLVLPDASVVGLVKGLAGRNRYRFERLASPQHKLDWAEALSGSRHCLVGNQVWEAGVKWFFDRVEREYPEGVVLARVFNPQLLPEMLYHVATERDLTYIPFVRIIVSTRDGVNREALIGTVVWDGKTSPKTVRSAFSGIDGGVSGYYFQLVVGGGTECDPKLMKKHGLSYGLWRADVYGDEAKIRTRLTLNRAGTVKEMPNNAKPLVLTDFIMAKTDYVKNFLNTVDNCVNRSRPSKDGSG